MEKRIFQTSTITETASTDKEGIGTLRWVGHNLYRWVKNVDGVDFVAGDAACHDAGDIVDLLKNISVPATADLGLLAGIVQAVMDDDAAAYGWIQVLGTYSGVVFTVTTDIAYVEGDYLKGANGSSQLVLDAGTQPLYSRNIQVLEAMATAETPATTAVLDLLINCL